MPNLTKIAKTKDLPDGKSLCVTIGDKKIAVFNISGQYYAIDDECSHVGGNLSEGEVKECIVTCPWHGATFDLKTGNVLSGPAAANLNSYRVFAEGDDINLEV